MATPETDEIVKKLMFSLTYPEMGNIVVPVAEPSGELGKIKIPVPLVVAKNGRRHPHSLEWVKRQLWDIKLRRFK